MPVLTTSEVTNNTMGGGEDHEADVAAFHKSSTSYSQPNTGPPTELHEGQHLEEIEEILGRLSHLASTDSEIVEPEGTSKIVLTQGSALETTIGTHSQVQQGSTHSQLYNQPCVIDVKGIELPATSSQIEDESIDVSDARGDQQPVSLMDIDDDTSVQASETCFLDGSNMSTKTDTRRLYILMQIKSDKQDLSFVEKVMLPQADIFDLCNRIVPNSAKLLGHENQQFLNFDLLNSLSVNPIGFYGNKSVMLEVFSKYGIVGEAPLTLMREEKLLPGLYGILYEGTLHIFYWHQGQSLSDASRKDISCNFIRYLVELCDVVHICLDAAGLESLLVASKSNSSKKVRTRRLKLFVEKASENDLKVLPGFKIDLLDQYKDLLPAATGNCSTREVPTDVKACQLAEGFHRAAVLVATFRPPKMSIQRDQNTVRFEDVPQLVKTWQSQYNLDISRLEDKELIRFLHAAECTGHKELCDLSESLKQKKENQAGKNAYHFDELVSSQEDLATAIFLKGAYAYLKQHFPWEEALLSDEVLLKSIQAGLNVRVISYPSFGRFHFAKYTYSKNLIMCTL